MRYKVGDNVIVKKTSPEHLILGVIGYKGKTGYIINVFESVSMYYIQFKELKESYWNYFREDEVISMDNLKLKKLLGD